jgi:hypothetical protein
MQSTQGIYTTAQSSAPSLWWTQTPQAAATTQITVATSAVASGIFTYTPATDASEVRFREMVRSLCVQMINLWSDFGVTVEPTDIPSVPDDYIPMPGKFLILIPKGLTLNAIVEKFEFASFDQEVRDVYGQQAVESSYWIVCSSKDMIGIDGLFVARYSKLQRPTLIEVAALTLIFQKVSSDKRLGGVIACEESYYGHEIVAGGFLGTGLMIDYFRSQSAYTPMD